MPSRIPRDRQGPFHQWFHQLRGSSCHGWDHGGSHKPVMGTEGGTPAEDQLPLWGESGGEEGPKDRPAAREQPPSRPRASVKLPPLTAPEPPPSVPQRLLIVDTETTGLEPTAGDCIEVGAILFAVGPRAVLAQVSFLLPCASNPCEAINGIPAAVSRLSQPWEPLRDAFEVLVAAADAVVAHNVGFDRQWFGHGPLASIDKPWICSMDDIRWPADLNLRSQPSLRDLALAHSIPVWAAHRALTDCIYLAQVFERRPDLEQLLQVALEPRRLFKARVSYDDRQLARQAGFRWNDPVKGAWTRRLSDREVAALPFPAVPIDLEPDLRRSA